MQYSSLMSQSCSIYLCSDIYISITDSRFREIIVATCKTKRICCW